MDIFDILTLIGGLSLFLYGMNVMGDGLKKTSGGKLERILGKITSNRIMAVLIGTLVTAVMQSSSATTVMIVGFVNSGLMELSKAVLVILGANIGATVTPWVMSLFSVGGGSTNYLLEMLKPSSFAPIMAIVGVGIILISKNQKRRNIALILIGFAVLMFGMETMSDAVSPLADDPKFGSVMMMFSNPLLGTLVGIVLTAVIQSSSATIGMVQVLSAAGLVTYGSAIPIILGANIGTCATALLSSIGTGRNARRSALIHLTYNIVRSVVFLIVFYLINHFVQFQILEKHANPVGIAIFDTSFSIAFAILLFPCSKIFEKIAFKLIPVTEEEADKEGLEAKMHIKLLDERFLRSPGLAIEQVKRVAIEMANDTREALFMALDLISEYKEKRANKVIDLESIVDHYEDELGTYLVKLSTQPLAEKDSQIVSVILHSIGDLERISDHAVNIMESARELHDKEVGFSKRATEEIEIFTEALRDIVNTTFDSFINEDLRLAANVEPLEEVIDEINNEIKKRHVKRLRKGKCSIEMGFVLSDISTNYERVADHCSNIALSILQKDEDTVVGAHEYQDTIVSKNNEEYSRLVMLYGEKYRLPKKAVD